MSLKKISIPLTTKTHGLQPQGIFKALITFSTNQVVSPIFLEMQRQTGRAKEVAIKRDGNSLFPAKLQPAFICLNACVPALSSSLLSWDWRWVQEEYRKLLKKILGWSQVRDDDMNLDRLRGGKRSMKHCKGDSDLETNRSSNWQWSKSWDPSRDNGYKVKSTGIRHCIILKDWDKNYFLGCGDWDKLGKKNHLVQGTDWWELQDWKTQRLCSMQQEN